MNGLRNQPFAIGSHPYSGSPLQFHKLLLQRYAFLLWRWVQPSLFGAVFLLAVPFSAKHFLAEILCHFFIDVFCQSLCFLSGDFLWKCGQHRLCPFPAVCACLLRTDRDSLSGNHGSLPASAGRAASPVFSP